MLKCIKRIQKTIIFINFKQRQWQFCSFLQSKIKWRNQISFRHEFVIHKKSTWPAASSSKLTCGVWMRSRCHEVNKLKISREKWNVSLTSSHLLFAFSCVELARRSRTCYLQAVKPDLPFPLLRSDSDPFISAASSFVWTVNTRETTWGGRER